MIDFDTEIKAVDDKLAELRVRGKELQGKKELFRNAAFLDDEIRKARSDLSDTENTLKSLKEKLSVAEQAQRDSVAASSSKMTSAMAEMLPSGFEPFISVDGDIMQIGLNIEGKDVPYHGLSGAQRVIFHSALEYCMMPGNGKKLIIVEAGEMDIDRLSAFLGSVETKHPQAQVIVNTWHFERSSEYITEHSAWKIVELGGGI